MKKDNEVKYFDKAAFKKSVERHLLLSYGQKALTASNHYWYLALCKTLSEISILDLLNTEQQIQKANTKSVNYFSLEFLIGRLTGNNLINLGLYKQVELALVEMGLNLTDLLEQERDPALGNGGLGRLAACYLDSLAAQHYPAVGYGLHYQYGLFRQSFEDAQQMESPDQWLDDCGYPWEILRPELTQEVGWMGHVAVFEDENGELCRRWEPTQKVKGIARDIPVLGYQNDYAVPLRLWECQAVEPFDLGQFNQGEFFWAHSAQIMAANITQVLYPNDQHQKGKMLRLSQQYFLCACSLGDMLRRHLAAGRDITRLAEFETVQLNDTHPAIAIPELMRLLLDQYQLGWETSWQITTHVFAYTNHTLLPEALECWSQSLMAKLLPRHMEIIAEINVRFLAELEAKWPANEAIKAKLSIISFDQHAVIRMANLSVVCSYAVNGVARLHSELIKQQLFPEFDELYPQRLTNITNGVTPRRWLALCNPGLTELISSKIGDNWQTHLSELSKLAAYADDPEFQQAFYQVKQQNKQRLADYVFKTTGIELALDAIFDVQIKRLHEYKRQHLNLLHILSLYYRLLNCPDFDMHPRVFIFAAKAAPAYSFAKEIIFAINKVAEKINHDPRLNGKLKLVFLEDYCVSLAELIIPAADVSEQISTAGKEASGTGNMKLALNGALTIGTLDGANVEILEEVGQDNIFIFGLTVDEVAALWRQGYHPKAYYQRSALLQSVLRLLELDEFTPGQPGRLAGIAQNLLYAGDPYLVLADFEDYVLAQEKLDKAYGNRSEWLKKAILNTALMGKFSSDRSICDYANNIWKIKPLKRE